MSTIPAAKVQTSAAVVDTERPWPGLFPFTEEQHDFFFGRDEETAELFRHVKRDILTVLYSKSGLGKSSLLQAGLFPRLRAAAFLPVYIRLKYDDAAGSSESQIKAALQDAIQDAIEKGGLAEAASPAPDELLWEYLHRRSGNLMDRKRRVVYPVLVFDQFEEIFTRGEDNENARQLREQFLTCLANLVESPRIPQELSEQLADDPELATQFAAQFDVSPTGYKFVVALRDEYVPSLDDLRQIPSLASSTSRMSLKQLNGEQALLAVSKPNPELVTTEVSELIVRFVAGDKESKRLGKLEVAPAILSLFCQELNKKRVDGKLPQITADLVKGNADTIIDDFYHRCVDNKPAPVQRLIEEDLVNESGYRDDIDLDEAKKKLEEHAAPGSVIDELVDDRVLHIEDYRGRPRLELTHDVLLEPVKRRREQRREEEAREKEETQKALALEAQLAKEREAAREAELNHLQELAAAERDKAAAERERATSERRLAEEQRRLAAEQKYRAEEKARLVKILEVRNTQKARLVRALAVVSAIAILLAGYVGFKYWQYARATRRVDLALNLAKKAQESYLTDPELSAKLALKSIYVTWKANQPAVQEARDALELVAQSALNMGSIPKAVALSPDWKHLAAVNGDDSLAIEEAIQDQVAPSVAVGYAISATPNYYAGGANPYTKWLGSKVGATTQLSCQYQNSLTTAGSAQVPLWEATSVRPTATFLGVHAVGPPTVSEDGKYVAFTRAGSPNAPMLWNLSSGSDCKWKMLPGDKSVVHTFAFSSPQRGLLAIGNSNGKLSLWDLGKMQELGQSPMGEQGHGPVQAVAFSPDGKRVAIGSADGTVSVLEVETGRQLHNLQEHKGGVVGLAFSPGRNLLLTAALDNSVRVWDTQTGKSLGRFPLPAGYPSVALSHDGKRLVAASDTFAKVWEVGNNDVGKWAVLYVGAASKSPIAGIYANENGSQFVTVTSNGTLNVHTIRWEDGIAQVWKRGVKKFTPQECEQYLPKDRNCNDFYDDKSFNTSIQQSSLGSAQAQH